MNFNECYKKLESGTATEEEAAFVATEIVKARQIMNTMGEGGLYPKEVKESKSKVDAILSSDVPLSAEVLPAESETILHAKKKHMLKMTIRIIIVTLLVLGIVTGGVLWYIFGTAARSAKKHEVYTQEQAIELAKNCVENYVGHDINRLMIHDIDRHLNMAEGIYSATRVLEIELNDGVTEYEVRVNLSTGVANITDIDN